ncbi:hypothetical protein ACFQ3P_20800 [Paraburkholderia sabiae]|uniref:CobQ/CobB/MinD/ParA nucleotide binding domain-containing protein n=1 Tax=Paraburkholderia sabiae TaxID=273251 RepID=A0ABU9QK04_9BURK|nr:hypothetical protein [Paraburkholderia sabiae]WJZ73464.1 hypothetical protein QEN71_25535 [Paraburkholderia sabiae]CAD6542370.1 hypothetical protein LMG24235_03781 [Paraburkholderia sabiae]
MKIETRAVTENKHQSLPDLKQTRSSDAPDGTRSLLVRFDSGSGKSAVASMVLHQFCPGTIYSVHDPIVNRGTGAFGVPAVHVSPDMLASLAVTLQQDPGHLLVDVSTCSVVVFIDFISRNPGVLSRFDLVVIPVKPQYHYERSAIDTATWLLRQQVNPQIIRFVFNHLLDEDCGRIAALKRDADRSKLFPLMTQFLNETPALGQQTHDCRLPETFMFDLCYLGDAMDTMTSTSAGPHHKHYRLISGESEVEHREHFARLAYRALVSGLPREHAFAAARST